MQFLETYVHQSSAIRRLISEAMTIPGVQGVMVDLDDEWLAWQELVQRFGRKRALRVAERYRDFLYPRGPFRNYWHLEQRRITAPRFVRSLRWDDLGDVPPYWDEYRWMIGADGPESPVVTIVRLRSDAEIDTDELADRLPTEGL